MPVFYSQNCRKAMAFQLKQLKPLLVDCESLREYNIAINRGNKGGHWNNMKRITVMLFALSIFLCSCSTGNSTEGTTSDEPITETIEETVSYETAFNFVKQCEEAIINANEGVGPNKLGESAAEFAIFSDEYAGLFCAYWAALEEIDGHKDSRFEKTKLRWQVDYTNDEWKNLLISAFNENGTDGIKDEYGRIYNEIVWPILEEKWEKSLTVVDYTD